MAVWADTRWTLTTHAEPSAEPLSYSEVASLLQRGTDTSHQTWLTAAIVAARRKVEADTGRRLITQTVDLTFDAFPSDAIRLPVGPLQSVTSITTVSVAGASSAVTSTNYQVDTAGERIVLADAGVWPADIRAHAGIVARCVVGYGTTGTSVPSNLLRAVEHLIAKWYAHRLGDPDPSPKFIYDDLIAEHRRLVVA